MAVERKADMKKPGEIKGSVLTHNITSHDCEKAQNYKLPALASALKASAVENAASFHFLGHNRGQAAPSSFTQLIGKRPHLHGLPGLPELDNLSCPEVPILEAQRKAAELFGASDTWFLVGGSTCGVQAAVMATCSPGDNIILPRNYHLSAISAMILAGALPKYIMPEYNPDWDIAGGITPSQVEKAIKELEMEGEKVGAVFVVSPTYHGICSNVAEISQLCHLHNVMQSTKGSRKSKIKDFRNGIQVLSSTIWKTKNQFGNWNKSFILLESFLIVFLGSFFIFSDLGVLIGRGIFVI